MFDGFVATMTADPVLAGAAFPLVAGLVFALVAKLAGDDRGTRVAMLGAVVAFLLVYLALEGLPPLPPVAAKQKLFWFAMLCGIAGVGMAVSGRAAAAERVLLVLLPAAGIFWLGERQWLRGPETGFVVLSVLLWLVGATILLRLRATHAAGQGFVGASQLLVAAAGLAAIALIGASTSLATLAGALAAGLGGVLLADYAMWLVKGAPFGLGAAGRLSAGSTFVFIAANLVLFADGTSLLAIAALSLVFVSGRLPLRFDRLPAAGARILEPARGLLLALLPAAIAVGIALIQVELTAYP